MPAGFVYRWSSSDTVHYAGMAIYKIGILLLNLVPYLALRIAA